MPIKKLKEQLTLLMGKYKTIIHLEKKRGVNLSFVTKDHHKDFHFNFLCRMWIIQELANLNCNGPDSRYSRLCNQEAKLRRLCRYLYNHLKYNLKFLQKKTLLSSHITQKQVAIWICSSAMLIPDISFQAAKLQSLPVWFNIGFL